MSEKRLGKVLKEFNIGMSTLTTFLDKKGINIESNPNAKLPEEAYELVSKEFRKEQIVKEESKKVAISVKNITKSENKSYSLKKEESEPVRPAAVAPEVKVEPKAGPQVEQKAGQTPEIKEENAPESPQQESVGPKVLGKIDLSPKPKTARAETAPEAKAAETAVQEPVREETKSAPEAAAVRPEQQKEAEKPQNTGTELKQNAQQQTQAPKEQQPQKAKEPMTSTASNSYGERTGVEFIGTKVEQLQGPKLTGEKIDLSQFEKKSGDNRGKRERIHKHTKEKVDVSKEFGTNRPKNNGNNNNSNNGKQQDNKFGKNKNKKDRFRPIRTEVDEDEVQKQIKETYQRMIEGKGKTKGSKYRREKRESFAEKIEAEELKKEATSKTLKVTEFVTVNDLATMINQPVTKVIGACMNLGLMVSINQRLDADALTVVAEDFGYKIEFVTADIQEAIKEEQEVDRPEDLVPRAPIVTVMGHVDHGKTSLLDYIRQSNVIAGEAGGITQHIGAYNVKLSNGRRITFLDTPGHEAFTAMRARGAKMTDLAIIIVAADDAVMPQTIEAINHAQAAGVPMIFAINKIDKPGAYPDKIREQLSQMNILVEDWGGKYQCQEISAKKGIGVDDLLEKVLLEADMLDLKANPNKKAIGTVIESSLDKGRGYLATVLVQGGTLHTGDIMLSGCYTGKIKAMFNERGQKIDTAGPSVPVSVLGLNGAPTAGDNFNIFDNEREAREIANKREQLIRIQGLRTQKHITLEELSRRIAIGNFKELNIIVKGDVDGSIEALSDSLIKLSTEEIHVNVIHKAVGEISESDVLLAEASNAIIIGFQVRPSVNARKMAEKEEIEIRLYSVIYDAINEVKSGIEGMLAPVEKEVVTATLEVRQTFKISKIGTIAGCMVKDGKITAKAKVRLIRDGIVIHTGMLGSLKRGKDDAKEVASGFDCGVGIENFNDIKEGDVIEAYKIEEIKRTL